MDRIRPIVPVRPGGLAAALLSTLLLFGAALPAAARDPRPMEDTPPLVQGSSLTPTELPKDGGTIFISVTILDDWGIAQAYARVTGPNLLTEDVMLGFAGGNDYTGTWNAPPNSDLEPDSYGFTALVQDTGGNPIEVLLGSVSVAPADAIDAPPVLSNPLATPARLPNKGGTVSLGVTATDEHPLASVSARVTAPSGALTDLPMAAGPDDRWTVSFEAPRNTATIRAEYFATITATDSIGQSVIQHINFSVAARPAGLVVALPRAVPFGRVKVGAQERRSVVLLNAGPQNVAPIQVTVTATGPFRIRGAGAAGLTVTLRRGQVRKLTVVFTPLKTGRVTGSLVITRADGRQPGLVVALSGRGR